jgi:hypothetical protein
MSVDTSKEGAFLINSLTVAFAYTKNGADEKTRAAANAMLAHVQGDEKRKSDMVEYLGTVIREEKAQAPAARPAPFKPGSGMN